MQKYVKKKPNILTIEESNEMITHLDTAKYDDYIFKLALVTTIELGLRQGEVLGLEWENIDIKNNTITIQNNFVYTNSSVNLRTPRTLASQRSLYISDSLLENFKKHKDIQDLNKVKYKSVYKTNIFNNRICNLIFTCENGNYIHPHYFSMKLDRLSKESGINKRLRFHDLRYTNANLLLEQCVDFKTIQTRLGYSDPSITLNLLSHITS